MKRPVSRPILKYGMGIIVLLLVGVACLPIKRAPVESTDGRVVLFDPAAGLGEEWEHSRLRRADTRYETVNSELGPTLRATGDDSASILFRLFEAPGLHCDRLEWSWRVAAPQPDSNLRVKGEDDVAASIFVIFGDPGLFLDQAVPTLKYVWANQNHAVGDVIAGPYHKKYIRSLIMQSGGAQHAGLVKQQVNLKQDYQRAFGTAAPERVFGVAIFTDNDDTQQPIEAHYGRIEMFCD